MVSQLWPFPAAHRYVYDRLAERLHHAHGRCNLCGWLTSFWIRSPNLREDVFCIHCRASNRGRQMAAGIQWHLSAGRRPWAPLSKLKSDLRIWNLEANGQVHVQLSRSAASYVCSEFVDGRLLSGTQAGGILHVDVQKTHFADASFDLVLSSDVLEHVPQPLTAFREIFRVLKPGGAHVFTVPFYRGRFANEQRATLGADGEVKLLLPAQYHGDPIRSEGILVFTIFAGQMLGDLEAIGYRVRVLHLRSAFHGILGDPILFIASKPA